MHHPKCGGQVPGLEISLSVYADEGALLEGLRQHEPDACACLIKRFSAPLYARALRIVGDPDDAEGVLQLTFIKACEKLGTFEGRSSLGSWLASITTNEALMLLRRRHPHVLFDDLAEAIQPDEIPQCLTPWPLDPAQEALSHELHTQLERALAALPDSLRVVFVLREIEGRSTQETATLLGLGESAVKVRLHRARLRLREQLAHYLTDQDAVEGGYHESA